MFSSFPTTRHSFSENTNATTTTKEQQQQQKGDDFNAYGAFSWSSMRASRSSSSSSSGGGLLKSENHDEVDGEAQHQNVPSSASPSAKKKSNNNNNNNAGSSSRARGAKTTTSQSSLLRNNSLTKSPRSPKDPFDEETYTFKEEALFPVSERINECLRLVAEGDAPWETPKVTAICLASNEDVVSEKQPVGTNKYRRKAGTIIINEDFMEQGYNGGKTTSGKARTGDCIVTKGGGLPGVEHLVHCVVPRYVARYKTAAETALVHCYRNALSMCIEDEVGSRNVGLTLLHRDERKCYPRREGAEVLARTVRRFLEKWVHKFESVVILFPDEETKAYYEKEVLPIYFPRNLIELQRSREEAMECDENGERVIVGRTISIDAFPSRHDSRDSRDDDDDVDGGFEGERAATMGSRSESMDNNGAMSEDSSVGEDEDLGTNTEKSTNPTTLQPQQQEGRKSVEITIGYKGGRRWQHGKGLLKSDKHSLSNKSMNNLSEVLNVPLGVTIATPATGATFISQHETPEERRARVVSISQGNIEPWLLLNEATKLNANFDKCLSSVEDTTTLENEEIEYAKLLRVASHSLDQLNVLESATRAVTVEKHADFAGRRIITIVGAFAERMLREGEGDLLAMSLANNVVNASQEGAASGFIIIYHHTGQNSDSLTSEQFEMLLSKALGPAHCQAQLKALYVVHPGTKMKAQCWWSSLGINRNDGACAALGKAVYVNTLEELNAYVRVQGGEELDVPAHVKDFDANVAAKGSWY